MKKLLKGFTIFAVGLSLVWANPAEAQVRGIPLPTSLGAIDDAPSAHAALGFSINFFGTTYDSVWVNNNGNVTFNSAFTAYVPTGLAGVGQPILAPFFADVDTRGAPGDGSGIADYGTRTVATTDVVCTAVIGCNPRDAWTARWKNVTHYDSAKDNINLNFFSLVIIDRGDTGAGNFDFEFNYNTIVWEGGSAIAQTTPADASGLCPAGLGAGCAAEVGWYKSGASAQNFIFAGSQVAGALVDGGPMALVSDSLRPNSGYAAGSGGYRSGRYIFAVRNGQVQGVVPEPMTFVLMGTGLIGVGLVQIRRRRNKDVV